MCAECRCFTLAAILTKQQAGGPMTLKLVHGYRIATDGEDAVIGRWVRSIMRENPDWSMAGNVSVLEVLPEEIAEHFGTSVTHPN